MIKFAGHLRLRAEARENGDTILREQSFRAPYHLSKPYWDVENRTLIVQVVNPTAGILAGDQLASVIVVDPGASVLVTTPSASRVFMMAEGAAESRQKFIVARAAWLEVSPEPLVPHRGSRFWQTTEIEIEPGGGVLYVDQIMPGRLGFGEAWGWTELRLDLAVRVGGELMLRERFAHSGSELEQLARFAGSGATACFANIVLIASESSNDARWRMELNRLHDDGVWVGVSALRCGGWTIRAVAPDPIRLRETLRCIRAVLSSDFPRLRCGVRKL